MITKIFIAKEECRVKRGEKVKATFHDNGSVLIEWEEKPIEPFVVRKFMRNSIVDPEWLTEFCYTEKELRKLKLLEINEKRR